LISPEANLLSRFYAQQRKLSNFSNDSLLTLYRQPDCGQESAPQMIVDLIVSDDQNNKPHSQIGRENFATWAKTRSTAPTAVCN